MRRNGMPTAWDARMNATLLSTSRGNRRWFPAVRVLWISPSDS
jgi:hypothetical protein